MDMESDGGRTGINNSQMHTKHWANAFTETKDEGVILQILYLIPCSPHDFSKRDFNSFISKQCYRLIKSPLKRAHYPTTICSEICQAGEYRGQATDVRLNGQLSIH